MLSVSGHAFEDSVLYIVGNGWYSRLFLH